MQKPTQPPKQLLEDAGADGLQSPGSDRGGTWAELPIRGFPRGPICPFTCSGEFENLISSLRKRQEKLLSEVWRTLTCVRPLMTRDHKEPLGVTSLAEDQLRDFKPRRNL